MTSKPQGTIEVCVECLDAAVNGELPEDWEANHVGPYCTHGQPWSLWDRPDVTPGILQSAHDCGLERVSERAFRRVMDSRSDGGLDLNVCGCDETVFSMRPCAGCGCYLGGSRHGFVWWAE